MKHFFWFCLGLTSVLWVLCQEQHVAVECMGSGYVWNAGLLIGSCANPPPAKPTPPSLFLPPIERETPAPAESTGPQL